MILYPAIDLKDGKCVRLLRGEMSAATVFNADPADQARQWERAGFRWLHLVDLNGAIEGKPVNGAAVEAILGAIKIPAQLGGGSKVAIPDFQKAIDLENPADDQLWYFPTIAAAYADPAVGRMDDARKIVKTLLSRKPQYSMSNSVSRSFPYRTQEQVDRYVSAARSLGLPE